MPTGTVLAGTALLIALAAPAAAQKTSAAVADTRPLIGVGLSFLTDGEETGTGLIVDFSRAIGSTDAISIGGVGDFGWHSFHVDGYRSMTFMGGARVTWTEHARFAPFGQFLIGGVRFDTSSCEDCSETHLAFGPGGGVDIAINHRWRVRAQIDFFIIRFGGGEEAADARRFTVGLSLPIGG